MDTDDKAARAKAKLDDAVRRASRTPDGAAIAIGNLVLHLIRSGEQTGTAAIVAGLRAVESGDLRGVMLVEQATGAIEVIRQLRPELVSR